MKGEEQRSRGIFAVATAIARGMAWRLLHTYYAYEKGGDRQVVQQAEHINRESVTHARHVSTTLPLENG